MFESQFQLLRVEIWSISSCWTYLCRLMYLLLRLKYSISSSWFNTLRLWGFLAHSGNILKLNCSSSWSICLKSLINFISPFSGLLLSLRRHDLYNSANSLTKILPQRCFMRGSLKNYLLEVLLFSLNIYKNNSLPLSKPSSYKSRFFD